MRFLPIVVIFGIVLGACKKDPKTNPVPPLASFENIDLGIQFTRYSTDSLYVTDTIQNEFRITNFSNVTIPAGNELNIACSLGGLQFALDLIGEGPSKIALGQDLAPGQSFVYNPGYLLGQSLMDYFQTDTVQVAIMVYGVNNVVNLSTFNGDPNPGNNTCSLNFFASGLKLN